jgi:hypothetical protein
VVIHQSIAVDKQENKTLLLHNRESSPLEVPLTTLLQNTLSFSQRSHLATREAIPLESKPRCPGPLLFGE